MDEPMNWRKSSHSADNGGECVEVADHAGRVLVRDTKDRTGPVLGFPAAAWHTFAAQVRRSLGPDPDQVAGRGQAASPRRSRRRTC